MTCIGNIYLLGRLVSQERNGDTDFEMLPFQREFEFSLFIGRASCYISIICKRADFYSHIIQRFTGDTIDHFPLDNLSSNIQAEQRKKDSENGRYTDFTHFRFTN